MTILEKALRIYEKYYLCPYCLGRMFSLLGTNVSNFERGNSILLTLTMEYHSNYLSGEKSNVDENLKKLKILAEKAMYLPAIKVLENEGIKYLKFETEKECDLCNNIFFNLNTYANKVLPLIENIEFSNFLVGTSLDSQIINKEDIIKSEFNIIEAEAFKSHFNREIGKILAGIFKKPAEFNIPDILFIFEITEQSVIPKLKIKPRFIYGRYKKFVRGIPQTHWDCKKCNGKGCEHCNFSGKQYAESVEELISPTFLEKTKASHSKFHGAGREDIDVRMIGTGRPFILELKNPHIRTIDLDEIKEIVNKTNQEKIEISDLRYSDRQEVIRIKTNAENTKKIYKALVESENEIKIQEFDENLKFLKEKFRNCLINQRTPVRVSHRRADKIRDKIIYSIEGKYLNANQFEFLIETQGGTYIKELISGDEGRTTPSLSEIFNTPLRCKELDVIKIEQ
ncbi:MAG: tRNA pseudouridine(54/55) synthase Pus10 [Promethearchaeota archaeon]